MMTTFATFLGLIPLALALEAGSEQYAPLARAIIGGLMLSFMVTLFLVPGSLLPDASQGGSRRAGGEAMRTPRSLRFVALERDNAAVAAAPDRSHCMSSFAIKYPFFILMLCLGIIVVGVTTRGTHAGGPVPRDQDSGRRGGHFLQRHAAAADRGRHHRYLRALLHPGQQHRSHRVAIAHRGQPDQGLLPARHRSGRCGQRNCQSGHGGPAPVAAGNAASGGAEVRCLQPAGVPGDAEGPGAERDRSCTTRGSSTCATRSRMCPARRCRSPTAASTGRSSSTSIR